MINRVVRQEQAGKDSKVLRIVLFVSSLLILLSLTSTSQGQEAGKDRPGMNYRSFDLPEPDPVLCRRACDDEPRCKAYTYVKPGIQGPKARCWLKSGVPEQVDSDCCISGVKLLHAQIMDQAQPMAKPGVLIAGMSMQAAKVQPPEPKTPPQVFEGNANARERRIDLRSVDSEHFKLIRATGVETVAREAGSVNLRFGELLAVRTGQNVTKVQTPEGTLRLKLPFRIYGVKAGGGNLDLETVIEVEGGGIYPTQNESRFEGNLYVGVTDENNPTATQALPQLVHFLVTPDFGSIAPAGNVSVDHTNLPFKPLKLVAVSPPNSIKLHIRPSFSDTSTETQLRVYRPVISLEVSPDQIQGLGLEVAKITVMVDGIAGTDGKVVTLDADKGGLTTTRVSLDSTGTGSTEIRSIGSGAAKITARFPGAAATSINITFMMPWGFLFWAGVGGLVGAVIRHFTLKPEEKGNSMHSVAGILIGILAGVVVAAGLAVGMDLLNIGPIATVGQAAIWVAAALGGFAGKLVLPGSKGS